MLTDHPKKTDTSDLRRLTGQLASRQSARISVQNTSTARRRLSTFQIRWHRLIVDEGHNTTNVAISFNLVSKMSVQSQLVLLLRPLLTLSEASRAIEAYKLRIQRWVAGDGSEGVEEKGLKPMEKMTGGHCT